MCGGDPGDWICATLLQRNDMYGRAACSLGNALKVDACTTVQHGSCPIKFQSPFDSPLLLLLVLLLYMSQYKNWSKNVAGVIYTSVKCKQWLQHDMTHVQSRSKVVLCWGTADRHEWE